MANIIDSPAGEWVANEVYLISQADKVEGAATGASFGGLGVDNYPHQLLANRTSYLFGQVSNLNTEVAAIQARLVPSGGFFSNTFAINAFLTANGAFPELVSFSFTFPPSSITGQFCLLAWLNLEYIVPAGQPAPVNFGGLAYSLRDLTSGINLVEPVEQLLVAGPDGAGSFIVASGLAPKFNYTPGATISVLLSAGVGAAGFPVTGVTLVAATITLMSFSL